MSHQVHYILEFKQAPVEFRTSCWTISSFLDVRTVHRCYPKHKHAISTKKGQPKQPVLVCLSIEPKNCIYFSGSWNMRIKSGTEGYFWRQENHFLVAYEAIFPTNWGYIWSLNVVSHVCFLNWKFSFWGWEKGHFHFFFSIGCPQDPSVLLPTQESRTKFEMWAIPKFCCISLKKSLRLLHF